MCSSSIQNVYKISSNYGTQKSNEPKNSIKKEGGKLPKIVSHAYKILKINL